MKIAIPYDNGLVFQHFGKSTMFKFYTVEQGKLTRQEVVSPTGSGHDQLSAFLLSHGVDTVVCGGMGGGAQQALAAAGIAVYGGVHGSCDLALSDLLAGRLQPGMGPDAACQDKGLSGHCGHHEGGHTCHGQ